MARSGSEWLGVARSGSECTANFCYSCGKELNEKADEPKSRKLSYEDFRKRKAEERGSKFCEKAKGNAPSSKNTEASEVIIQTGEMI